MHTILNLHNGRHTRCVLVGLWSCCAQRCVDAAYGDLRSRASAAVARNKGLAVAGGTPVAGATPTVNRALQ
jgi:hypothetical protein